MSTAQFFLPDTLADYPWPRHLNPHYEVVAPESSQWTESFKAFSPKAQKSFNRCDFGSSVTRSLPFGCSHCGLLGKLALLAYPLHDKGKLPRNFYDNEYSDKNVTLARARTGCDLMNLFFIIDEHSDVEGEHVVQDMANIIMDALRNPHKPRTSGEWVGGEATRQ